MAEAHSAVAFSFAITHEGVDVNFDREVLHLVWSSGVRSWKKRIARMQVSCKHYEFQRSVDESGFNYKQIFRSNTYFSVNLKTFVFTITIYVYYLVKVVLKNV